jgi:hypothetical protein
VPPAALRLLSDYDWAEQEVAALWRASGGHLSDVLSWSVGEVVLARDMIEVERLIQKANAPE